LFLIPVSPLCAEPNIFYGTISILSIESQPSTSDENTSGYLSVENVISPDLENSVENDDTTFRSPTPLLNRPSRTPTPNSTNTKNM